MIRDVITIHRAVTSAQPALTYTTSVVEAPKRDESKDAGYGEPNLRELLLSTEGTADYLF